MSIKKKGSEVKKLRRLSLAQLPPHCPDQLGAPHRCALPQECVQVEALFLPLPTIHSDALSPTTIKIFNATYYMHPTRDASKHSPSWLPTSADRNNPPVSWLM